MGACCSKQASRRDSFGVPLMDVENLNANASLEQANQTIKRLGREVKRLIALIDKVNVEIKEARREKAAYLQEDVALDVARKEQQIESITQRCST